ncbi:MAG: cytochrome P450 [Actinomycetota bacterium]|nr:cytochrome P450 [Actinomycetota bacterium]
MTTTIPVSSIDLYSDELIREPYQAYAELRELGPVVWLEASQAWAITRYKEVRAATENWEVFSSAEGVSLTPFTNETIRGTTIASDPPLHDHLRSVIGERLTPRALRPMHQPIQDVADELVARLVAKGSFDAVSDLARELPMKIVPDFAGWPKESREHLLPWAAAAFDTMGPDNERCANAMDARRSMFDYSISLAESRDLLPGSLGAGILDAVDSGQIEAQQCPALLLDYLAPALDTTISSVGSAVWLFSRYPDQWDAVRADPTLIPNAYNEVVRMESPVRGFSRVTTEDALVDGSVIPRGERVVLLWASANRDDRQFPNADTFDVFRSNANSHVGFGYGVHGCAGQGLARVEGHAIITALSRSVARFDAGTPVLAMNNVIRALASLPVTVTPA